MTQRLVPSFLPSLVLSFCLLALSGCGGVLSSSHPTLTVRDALATDALGDVELGALIEARPPVHDDFRVAWLAVAPGHDEALEASLTGLPGQRDAHRLSPLVAAGRRRFDEGGQSEISIQMLRILAARAHADVLVVVDHGWRSTRNPNGWAALSVLLVPSLFTPHLDADVEAYVETTVLDVRTGAILGETTATDAFHVANMTVWSSDDHDRAEARIDALLAETRGRLAAVLADANREADRTLALRR
jgi:hypothetical protein